jgi:hypothetical protein
VQTRDDFIDFVRALSAEDPAAWENVHTGRFLEALAAWVDDSDPAEPSWRSFAITLRAATTYE